jgi:hypothetical protein
MQNEKCKMKNCGGPDCGAQFEQRLVCSAIWVYVITCILTSINLAE